VRRCAREGRRERGRHLRATSASSAST
jgi:hypothetical protein